MPPRLILASNSPRRQELLKRAGYVFDIQPSEEDEVIESAHPATAATGAALKKAETISAGLPDGIVIGADTLVVCDGKILLKPIDAGDAERMLRLLSGNLHVVYTGVAVIDAGADIVETFFEETAVFFRHLADEEIAAYIASGEPLDKAGAYGIQELGACFVRRVEGCYFNVVGLPVPHLCSVLSRFGLPPLQKGS